MCVPAQDAVEGRRIIVFVLRYLDEEQLWSKDARFAAGIMGLLEEVCKAARMCVG